MLSSGIIPIFALVNEIEAGRLLFLFFRIVIMERAEFQKVVDAAAAERGCKVIDLKFDDDDNVFEVTIDRVDGPVELDDCEFVHRAVLAAFDRNIEDYALTVGSAGIDAEQADEILKTIND